MCSSSMRGATSAPIRLIKKAFEKHNEKSLELVMVDEYMTSQICNKCSSRNLKNVVTERSKRRVHAALKCNQNYCNMVCNCDIIKGFSTIR